MIEIQSDKPSFTLHAGNATYAFEVNTQGDLTHLYWGPRLTAHDLSHLGRVRGRAFSPNPHGCDDQYTLDSLPQEYPAYGTSDFRSPAVEVQQPRDGSRIVELKYAGHRVIPGKSKLEGLPATFVTNESDAESLIVTLRDAKTGFEVELLYTVFAAHPVITRSARLVNGGSDPLQLRRALSCSVDFLPEYAGYSLLHLSGAWTQERNLIVAPLRPGMQSVESRRGASSHQHNPFVALTELGANEEHGRVYGMNLVYSGNFLGAAEVDIDGQPRLQIGINPFDFGWLLNPGEAFQTPEAVLIFSADGLGGMSRAMHRFYRHHLLSPKWVDRPRPIVINNWEATYFNFTTEKLCAIAEQAAKVGVEMLVVDDGWFGHRTDDKSSLGDWTPDLSRLPGGLEELGRRVTSQGMKLGLWFEPEMISPDSDLFRQHPDWRLHVPGRPGTLGRAQHVLDFSRPEVREEIFQQMANILRTAPITFVKWDMNRHMTEIGSAALPPERQLETAHRYMLGVYAFLERFTREFPEVLIEGCSGGGGRFDPAMLYYTPQIWTSDNSDAISRLKIQYGTTLLYPFSTLSAHVSHVPNSAVGRVTPFTTRGHVALTGAFGYELDLTECKPEELDEIRVQVAAYKTHAKLLLEGDLYRLRSPFTNNESAWMMVAPDRSEALVTYVLVLSDCNTANRNLPLRGLDPARRYRLMGTERVYSGDALLQGGVELPIPDRDFRSTQWHFVSVDW